MAKPKIPAGNGSSPSLSMSTENCPFVTTENCTLRGYRRRVATGGVGLSAPAVDGPPDRRGGAGPGRLPLPPVAGRHAGASGRRDACSPEYNALEVKGAGSGQSGRGTPMPAPPQGGGAATRPGLADRCMLQRSREAGPVPALGLLRAAFARHGHGLVIAGAHGRRHPSPPSRRPRHPGAPRDARRACRRATGASGPPFVTTSMKEGGRKEPVRQDRGRGLRGCGGRAQRALTCRDRRGPRQPARPRRCGLPCRCRRRLQVRSAVCWWASPEPLSRAGKSPLPILSLRERWEGACQGRAGGNLLEKPPPGPALLVLRRPCRIPSRTCRPRPWNAVAAAVVCRRACPSIHRRRQRQCRLLVQPASA